MSESTERNVTQSIAAGNNEVGKTDTNTNLLPSISTSEIYIDNQRTQGRGHSHGTESLLGDIDGLKGIGNSRSEGNDGHAHQRGQALHTLLRNEQEWNINTFACSMSSIHRPTTVVRRKELTAMNKKEINMVARAI